MTINPAGFNDFMSSQAVRFGTMPKAFSVFDALSLLDAIVRLGGETALGAMRMAAAIVAEAVIAFFRERSGHEDWETTREPEHLFDDPANVERHLIITSTLSVLVGDDRFPALAGAWLHTGESPAAQAAFYEILLSDVEAVVRKNAPAKALRGKVKGRIRDARRYRAQQRRYEQGCHRSLLCIDEVPENEIAFQPIVGVEILPLMSQALRATGCAKDRRLAHAIEEFRDGVSYKDGGPARDQIIRRNLPRLRRLADELGIAHAAAGLNAQAPSGHEYGIPTTWYWETALRVSHRYRGAELECYREAMLDELPFSTA